METDKAFPPDPAHKIFVYPIIPLRVIKKFVALLPAALHRWLDDKKNSDSGAQFYGLLSTFIDSFKIEDIYDFIDKPDNEQFTQLLETNPIYALSKGGIEFPQFTPIYVFRRWLLANLYEGPPTYLRSDYTEGVFDENTARVICKVKFPEYKNVYDRLNDFSSDFENQTLEKFMYLTRILFCFPLEDLD